MTDTKKSSGKRRLLAGIVGGGRGALIASVHRIAAEMDGQARVVAGAMSSDPEAARGVRVPGFSSARIPLLRKWP